MSRRDRMDFVLLAALWGASFIFMRTASPEFGPIALVELRTGIAALCLWPVLWLRGGIASCRGLRHHWPALAFSAVANATIPWVLFAYASLSLTAAFASLLNATTPLWVALIGWLWLRTRLSAPQLAGLFLSLIGMLVLTWGKLDFKPGGSGLAVLAGLMATLSYGVAIHHAKRYLSSLSPLVTTTVTQTMASLILLPLALTYWPNGVISWVAWLNALMIGIFATALAMILYFRLIARIGGQKAASITFLIPVFAAAWGALLLQETLSLQLLVGGAVILIGTGLTLGLLKKPA